MACCSWRYQDDKSGGKCISDIELRFVRGYVGLIFFKADVTDESVRNAKSRQLHYGIMVEMFQP